MNLLTKNTKIPYNPELEAVMTMRPKPCFFIIGKAAWVVLKLPFKWTAWTRSYNKK